MRKSADHPNGYKRLENVDPLKLSWNAGICDCGSLKDKRAKLCCKCYEKSRRPEIKMCLKCETMKNISEFYTRKNGRLISPCKKCLCSNKIDRKKYYANSRSKPGHYVKVAQRIKKREQGDLQFKIANRLRNIVVCRIRNKSETKRKSSLQLIGCSVEQFLKHIESQWQPGMSWDNYGQRNDCWQLDHIRPVASFDLTKADDVEACFNYKNYQPLWAVDNRKKRDKWGEPCNAS